VTGLDPSSLGLGGIGAAVVVAVGAYVKDHRKLKADVDRDEAVLPLDLVHQATGVAAEQMSAMAAEMSRLRDRLQAVDEENDRLRTELRAARNDLDLAQGHLVAMWHRLAAVDPTMPRPAWLPE
jgi:uncharacterized protein (DUF3084 family)